MVEIFGSVEEIFEILHGPPVFERKERSQRRSDLAFPKSAITAFLHVNGTEMRRLVSLCLCRALANKHRVLNHSHRTNVGAELPFPISTHPEHRHMHIQICTHIPISSKKLAILYLTLQTCPHRPSSIPTFLHQGLLPFPSILLS